MKFGIIGAGMIGGTLARLLVQRGHDVSIANSRGPDSLSDVAKRTGAKAVTAAEAAKVGEIVVVTIPLKAVPSLKSLFAGVPKDVIVIDTNNYYPVRDGKIDELVGGKVESQWVAEQLGRPVVKVFNNIMSPSLAEKGKPKDTPGRLALSVAADAPDARKKVLELVDELGFDPVDAGPIADSWRQQPGTPSYCHDYDAPRMKQALAEADRAKSASYREAANAHLLEILASLKRR